MKFFNTAGPIKPEDHYCIPPLDRLDLQEILSLINQKKYFILHAPRQTGKTTCLLELMQYLNGTKDYQCLYINVEAAQAERENIGKAMEMILYEIKMRGSLHLNKNQFKQLINETLETSGNKVFNEILTLWTQASERPTVLLIDEIDALLGDTLISVLRQIRSGYDRRPESFPQSIVLCGVRDIRDYRMHSSERKEIITGGSAFNIKAKSLNIGNFTWDEVNQLYQCHSEACGQQFSNDAIAVAWEYSEGQPWIINALGYEVSFEMKDLRDRSKTIDHAHMLQAAQNLINRRETHIDQLVDKLHEKRVQSVIEPILSSKDKPEIVKTDDVQYVIDLGLIVEKPTLRIANRLYQEVIPRELTYSTERTISHETSWYITENNRIDMNKLLSAFQDFYRKHFDEWNAKFQYQESSMQLLMQAFLQRIINSGGFLYREYGLGRKRTDLLIVWPKSTPKQEIVIELKIRYGLTENVIKDGLEQTALYMDKCGTEEGHLVIFDRRTTVGWDEKIFYTSKVFNEKKIHVWGM
ncbi:ATPase domain protein, prokaryote domain protein [Candidatus Magnetomorum sp. HK-1]|nr:ATPase domain protein, prokaryote domain protein [Candidatus Magnetomorum sp. HK-1]